MDRATLEQAYQSTLIEIVLRQQEVIERLVAEVAELPARPGQPTKTPGTSSVPPSVGSVGFRPNRAGRRRARVAATMAIRG
jgi:hypothetical protein